MPTAGGQKEETEMGYVMAMSACFGCGKVFSYNPKKVPSIRDPKTGEKEAVCRECISRANKRRKEMNLPPHAIMPDAYEALPEEEL